MTSLSALSSLRLKESKSSIVFKANDKTKLDKKELKINETELGYHYEMVVPGYLKEDFRFYISSSNLVVTTQKEKSKDGKEKRSYCYPSALFRVEIPLPEKPIENKITVEYRNKILNFSLYKKE
ncbi:Hsp20/alpha crystallin family protein [Seonamhaeicola marinus]|uniref:Hsp20/alpha crystallin family protein n=1 Tax=Seonamhaeicola marinus TaxID=1912246 RepID=A0A5D0I473_9FLAO|nr:Hsp20/alpha crystallin family protein [Seonamhaeicola marinus]TYA78495.1 Hsp20/alpha crystallin family protein [Seonamhaeicola marinus]